MKKLLLTTLALCFILPQFAKADITSNLVGHWAFDDGSGSTAVDSGSGGNNGTLVASPTWIAGKIGPFALTFDGSTQSVTVGSGSALDIPGNITLSAWINLSSTGAGAAEIIDTYNGNVEYAFEVNRTAGKLSALADAATVAVTGNTTLSTGVWYNVAMVRSGTTGSWTYSLYINGVLDNSATVANNPQAFGSVAIGRLPGANIFFFPGSMDDARIYSRALSSSDLIELYNYPSPTASTFIPFILHLGQVFIKRSGYFGLR